MIWALNLGGAESMLLDIAAEQSLNAEVFLVVVNRDYDKSVLSALSHKVKAVYIDRPCSSRNLWHLVRLHRALLGLQPDIVHTHQHQIAGMLPFWRGPIVTTAHSTGIELSHSIRRCRKIFAISRAVKKDLLARYPELNVTVVHNGIAFGRIPQKESYGGAPFRLVQVGRLDYATKGQDVTLRALRYVTDELGEGCLTVDFIGAGQSREFLESLARDLGVAQWCSFLGVRARHETYDLLRTYDLLVQPSRHEGFGLTIVEGMAARIPVLVSDIEGPVEIIDGGRYGHCFRNNDFRDCADRIIEIMELSRTERMKEKLTAAYEYAQSCFSIEKTADRYMEEYQEVISDRNRGR